MAEVHPVARLVPRPPVWRANEPLTHQGSDAIDDDHKPKGTRVTHYAVRESSQELLKRWTRRDELVQDGSGPVPVAGGD